MLMYSHDGFGLGHIRRNLNIAEEAAKELNASTLMLMSHNSIPFLPHLEHIDFIKLPSIIKSGKNSWTPRTLPMNPDDFSALRKDIILHTVKHFQPNIFLIDYMPAGVMGELKEILPLLKMFNTKIILGLRDILDTPEHTKAVWEAEGCYELIENCYDHILIYGSEEVYPTDALYGLLPYKHKIHYTGYLTATSTLRSKASIANAFNLNNLPLILVTAGGGKDGFKMMQQAFSGIRHASKQLPLQALFVAGPLMSPKERDALQLQGREIGVKVIPHTDDLASLIHAADLTITMGSYNTLMETISQGKKPLVFPREGPSQEQKIRTNLFDKLGLVKKGALSPELLGQQIIESLKEKPTKTSAVDLNGKQTTIKLLKGFLNVEHTPADCLLHA